MTTPVHPLAPNRVTRLQRTTIWAALFVVPLIWVLHVLVCTTLVSAACTSGVIQRNTPPWDVTERMVTLSSALAFVPSLAFAIATGRAWLRIMSLAPDRRDAIRFVAWCSVVSSGLFTLALAFTASVLLALPLDRLCAPFQ
jgi:hypothetical protein